MKYQDYAFTLRKTTVKKIKPTEKTYADHIQRIFRDNGLAVLDYGFENEGGLHVHGIVELKEPFVTKPKRLRIRGWRLHLVPLFDQKGWVSYYNKNKKVVDRLDLNFDYNEMPDTDYVPTQDDLQDFSDYTDSIRGETLEPPPYSLFSQ